MYKEVVGDGGGQPRSDSQDVQRLRAQGGRRSRDDDQLRTPSPWAQADNLAVDVIPEDTVILFSPLSGAAEGTAPFGRIHDVLASFSRRSIQQLRATAGRARATHTCTGKKHPTQR